MLTGAYRLSKAKAARLLTVLFAIPLCAGRVCAAEAAVGRQLHPVVDDLLAATRQQPTNVDGLSPLVVGDGDGSGHRVGRRGAT